MIKQLLGKGKERALTALSPFTSKPEQVSQQTGSTAQLQQKKVAPVVAVLGAKGGCGATTVAINLAAAICRKSIAATLIDANMQQPDIATALCREPEHSLLELLSRAPEVERQVFDACAMEVSPASAAAARLNLLSPPLDGSGSIKTNLSELAKCVNSMRHYSDFLIVDMDRHLDRHLVTLADSCSKVLLVFEATVSGVAGCRRWLNIFKDLGYGEDRIVCVLNRAGSKPTTVEDQLSSCFGDRRIFELPNARSLMCDSATTGVPAVIERPDHQYSRAVEKLADSLVSSLARD